MKKTEIDIAGKRETGFTLIEVIVALAIITVGILAVNGMQTVSVRGNYTASEITRSSTWAADQVEEILNLPYSDLLDNNGNSLNQDLNGNGIDDDDEGTATDGVANFGLEETGAPDYTATSNDVDQRYTIDWNVADNYPMPDVRTVYVIVTRTERGITKSTTLQTMKAKFF